MSRRLSSTERPVGIDDLNIYCGTLAVETAAVASAREATPRELETVGFRRRSVTPPYEDAVTFAVNAAKPLLEATGSEDIRLLLVATESGVDYGKPLSAYVHRHLGLSSRCRNLEVKHACYGGTAAIQLATSWVRAEETGRGRALVVMTDLARRHFGDPGELTAGSGAVAVLVGAEPRVLEIEPVSGYSSREVYDVARPTATTEWADPVLSLGAYLDLIEEAWLSYRRAAAITTPLSDRFRFMLYHTPLLSLIRQAHATVLDADPVGLANESAAASFERMVSPSLELAREVSNVYSGSVYVLLAGLLTGDAPIEAGTRVGICSYGSGSCAEIYGGILSAGARDVVRRHGIAEHLAARESIDVGQYERLVRETDVMLVSAHYEPALDYVPGHFEKAFADRPRLVLRRIENHHRCYAWSTQI